VSQHLDPRIRLVSLLLNPLHNLLLDLPVDQRHRPVNQLPSHLASHRDSQYHDQQANPLDNRH
jgi:hypothetical protein